jgi:AcrR family transcriptional regulator
VVDPFVVLLTVRVIRACASVATPGLRPVSVLALCTTNAVIDLGATQQVSARSTIACETLKCRLFSPQLFTYDPTRRADRPKDDHHFEATTMTTKLSTDSIAAAALAIVDRVGVSQLTMRNLGAELGCSAMAVYAYFPNRDAVLHAAAEAVWREALSELDYSNRDPIEFSLRAAVALRRAFSRHGDIALVSLPMTDDSVEVSTRQNITTAVSRLFGVDHDRATEISYAMLTFTVGAAMVEAQRRNQLPHRRGPAAVIEGIEGVEHLDGRAAAPPPQLADSPFLDDDLASGRFTMALRAMLTGLLEPT